MIPRVKIRKPNSYRPELYLKPDSPNKPMDVQGLFGGVNVSVPAYRIEDNESPFIKNGFCKNGIFQKCPGLVQFGTTQPLDGKIYGLINYKLINGTTTFLALTGTSLYYLAANDVWTFVSSGEDFLTADDDRRVNYQVVYSETVGDYIVIITNYYDYIHYWNGTAIAHLFETWKAKFTCNYEHFQFYGYIYEGTTDYPQKLYWSDIGKPETITGGLSGGMVLAKTSDFLTGIAILGGALFIGKEKSCSIINYTGSYTFPFNLTENIFDIGVACGATIGNIGEELIFLGSDKKVYITDGAQKKDVSVKIKGLFSDRLNWGKINRSYGWVSPDYKWYLISVPTTGYDFPSETWVLDTEDWTWQPFQCWDKIISNGDRTQTGIKVGELTAKLGLSTWKLGELTLFEKNNLIGDSDGYIYEYNKTILNNNGVAISSYVDTKDYYWNPQLIKRVTQLVLEAAGSGIMSIWYSTDEGLSWTFISEIELTTGYQEHFTYPDKNCQKIRFRFLCDTADAYYYLKRFVVDKIDKGFVRDVS